MSITIGDALLWIRGKPDKLAGDLGAAEGQVKGWAGRLGTTMKTAFSVAAGQMITQGLNQISAAVQSIAKDIVETSTTYIREVEEMARATGVSVEEASRLIQVADDQRVSVEALTTSIRMYSQKMAQAGIATDISIDTIARLSDEYLRLAPGTERNAFLIENFGRSGLQMARLMEQGGDAIRAMSGAVDESLIVTQEAIDKQREYEVAMDDLGDAMLGVKKELAEMLLPYLTEFANWMVKTGIPVLKKLIDGFEKLPKPVRDVGVAFGGFIVAATTLAPAIYSISAIFKVLKGGAVLGGVAKVAGLAAKAIGGIGTAGLAVLGPIGLLIAAIGLLAFVWYYLGDMVTVTAKQWMAIWLYMLLQVSNWINQTVENIIGYFTRLWRSLVDTANRMASDLGNAFVNVGKSVINGIWNGISSGWDWLVSKVNELANSLLDTALDALGASSPSKKFAEVGLTIPQGMALGIEQGMAELSKSMQMQLALAPAGGGSAGGRINVGRIEYHGSFSRDELRRLDRRNRRIAGNTILEALE